MHSPLTGPRLGTARVCVSVILPGRCLSKITDNVITHRVRVRGSTSARQSWLYREPRRLGDYFDGGPRPQGKAERGGPRVGPAGRRPGRHDHHPGQQGQG